MKVAVFGAGTMGSGIANINDNFGRRNAVQHRVHALL